MEFDHRVASEKSDTIARIPKTGSLKRLKEEIDKCDLVCVMCHRRRTASRAGWLPNSDWILN